MRSMIDLAPAGEHRTGCFYGLHQVTADADISCYAEVVCRGSFELFVNGERIAVMNRHAERKPQTQHIGIVLGHGHNHVLVKTTLNGFSELSLRYVDAAGHPARGITEWEHLPQVRPHVSPVDLPRPEPFVEPWALLARGAGAVDTPARRTLALAAGLAAYEAKDSELGIEMLHRLQQSPPEGRQNIALAELWLRASPIPPEVRRSRARALIEAHAAQLPNHHYVSMQRVSFLEDEDKREQAVRQLQQRVNAGTAGPETFAKLYEITAGLEFSAESRRTRALWRARFPLDTRPTIFEATERAREGDTAGALSILLGALRTTSSNTLRRQALRLATDSGNASLALQMFDQIHQLEPDAIDALAEQAQLQRRLGNRIEELAAYRALAVHPDASAQWVLDAAEALLEAGAVGEATRAFERALQLDPSRHELRRLLARLGGKPEFPNVAQFRRDAGSVIESFVSTAREHTASSSLVLDQMIVQIFADGSSVEETHQIRRINDLRGVERYQEAKAAAKADEVIALRTIGVDGKTYEPSEVAGSFSMPRVEPGVFLEQAYRDFNDSPDPGPWTGPQFNFRSTQEPYLLSELVVIVPPNHRGSFRTRNYPDPPDVVALDNGFEAHVYRRTDVPRLATEQHAPPVEDVIAVVAYGEDGNSDAMARRHAIETAWVSYTTPMVEEQTAEVIAGCDSDISKVRAIHRFVHDQIASGPGSQDPTTILVQRRGPRFFLEAVMMELAGLRAQRAVVADRRELFTGRTTPFFTGYDSYQIPAMRVQPDGGAPFWLLADSPRYAPAGLIPYRRAGAPAILLQPGGAELTRLPLGRPDLDTGIAVSADVVLGAEGGAVMTATGTLRGAEGYYAADQVRAAEENIRQLIARRVAGQFFPGWTISSAELRGITEKGTPLGVHTVLERQRATEAAGDVALLALPSGESQFLARYGDRGTRTLPLVLTDMASSSWEITVDPGAHFRFVAMPPNVRVRHMLMDFTLSFRRDGDKIIIRRNYVQHAGTIPVSQFAEWIELLRRLDLAETTKLELKRRDP